MSATLARRLASFMGLAIAVAIACWWLGSSRLALDDRADTSSAAAGALLMTWLTRGMVMMLIVVRSGALRGWRLGAGEALALVAPAWPLAVFAWSASAVPWSHAVLAELLLCAVGAMLALIGQRLDTTLKRRELADVLALVVGVVLAAMLWLSRSSWAPLAS